MTSVYEDDAFTARVNLAATYIAAGRDTSCSRTFDTCFEMHDGDVVAAALVRRADANPTGRLAQNLFKYIGENLARQKARALTHIPTRELKQESAKVRAKAAADFDAFMEEKGRRPRNSYRPSWRSTTPSARATYRVMHLATFG